MNIIIFTIIIIGFAIIIWQLQRFKRGPKQEALDIFKEWMRDMRGSIDKIPGTLQQQSKVISERVENVTRSLREVSHGLGNMAEIGRQMKDFQDFLHSPKMRGNIGEQILRDLLEQILPKGHFNLQYKFRQGQVVDAIVKTNEGIIPIDSKFPMESFKKEDKKEFRRAVKKHIADIGQKYILPDEGTVDFAVMYVPSEAVYYEIVTNSPEIVNYASEVHVYLVSPNSFYYFLKIIMVGLESAKIEKASKEILRTLKSIQQDAGRFGGNLAVLARHITNAKNSMDNISNEYVKLSTKIDSVNLLGPGD